MPISRTMTSAKRFLPVLIVSLTLAGAACGAEATQKGSVSFASCKAAADAGYTSMEKGKAGYSAKLDGDGDGVACDKKMTFAECQASAEYPGGRYAVDFDNGVCTVQKP